MKKRLPVIVILCALMLSLTGCLFKTPDDLYVLPAVSPEYISLENQLDTILATGAEYAAPLSGTNTRTVQLLSEGEDQGAVAFFRVRGEEKPLRIYLFQKVEESYEVSAVIEGSGTSFDSVSYVDLNGDGKREIVVGWQISENVHTLSVYSVWGGVSELLTSSYTRYGVADLDEDGARELVLIRFDTGDGMGLAESYQHRDGLLEKSSTARLSCNLTAFQKLELADIQNEQPALFVTARYQSGYSTDILAWRDGGLANLALDPVTGLLQTGIPNLELGGRDIDGDGVWELPTATLIPGTDAEPSPGEDGEEPGQAPEPQYSDHIVNWWQYDLDGRSSYRASTCYNSADRWYLTMPEDWVGETVAVARGRNTAESSVTLYLWDGNPSSAQRLLTIYALTGEEREELAAKEGRFILATQVETIYVAECTEFYENWAKALDRESLIQNFDLINTVWGSENSAIS